MGRTWQWEKAEEVSLSKLLILQSHPLRWMSCSDVPDLCISAPAAPGPKPSQQCGCPCSNHSSVLCVHSLQEPQETFDSQGICASLLSESCGMF